MKHLNDSELISYFKSGNQDAFEELVLRYQSQVFSYVMSITKNSQASEDISQEVFIKVYKKLGSYNDESKFKNWLFTLSRNMTMDYYRKNSRKLVPLESQDDDEFSLIDVLTDDQPQPLEIAMEKDKNDAINRALNQLSIEERELIALKDSMTFKEIADMQKKPIGTLLSKFNRALTKLRTILSELEPEVYNEYMR